MRMLNVPIVFAMLLLSGCLGVKRDLAVPNHQIPHLITRDANVYISIRTADGTVEQEVYLQGGSWWIAPDSLVNPVDESDRQ